MLLTVSSLAAGLSVLMCYSNHTSALNSVGIKCIRSCSIDTPNCTSNWNEIVWLEGYKGNSK